MFRGKLNLGTSEKLVLAGLIGFLAWTQLDSIIAWLQRTATTILTSGERLAVPVGGAAVILGLILHFSPWHKTYANHLISRGTLLAALAGVVTVALTWLNTHVPGLVTGGFTFATNILNALGI